MIPTTKLRFVKRIQQARDAEGKPFSYATSILLQQWWETEDDHAWGGEWRDVPMVTEEVTEIGNETTK